MASRAAASSFCACTRIGLDAIETTKHRGPHLYMQHNDAPGGWTLPTSGAWTLATTPLLLPRQRLPSRAFSARTGLSGVPESCGEQGVDFADHAVDSADRVAQKDQ